jgi:ppGpp synthetase/RelA/SpoT-type nucleotidyltranferase
MADPEQKSPDEWGAVYRRQRGVYENCAKRYRWMLKDMLADAGIEVVQIEQRAKKVESLVKKIADKKGAYVDPLTDVTDLAGVRVITYYREDVALVEGLIRGRFEVDEERSVKGSDAVAPDEFRYTGDHLIVRHGAAHDVPPGWADICELWVEVQIRTATEHAWAAVDHKLKYKAERSWPPRLQRRFAQLKALFELADDQFSVLRREYGELERGYTDTMSEGDLEIPIDAVALAAYLAQTEKIAPLMTLAEELGWSIRPDAEALGGKGLGERPRELNDLALTLGMTGIETIRQFDEFLSDPETAEVLTWKGRNTGALRLFPEDLVCRLLLIKRGAQEPEEVRSIYGAAGPAHFNELRDKWLARDGGAA